MKLWLAVFGLFFAALAHADSSPGGFPELLVPPFVSMPAIGTPIRMARNPRGALVSSANCVGTACPPMGQIISASPNPASYGQPVIITGTSLSGALNQQCPYAWCSGITIVSGGLEIGTITDGTFVINSPTQITYTLPLDAASGQFYFGNSNGMAYAPFRFFFNPLTIAAVPTGLVQISGNAEVDLTFNPVPNGASYNIKRSTTSGSGYTTIGNISQNNLYNDLSVTNGVTYYYVVSSVNAIGESANSSQVVATPTLPPPGTVTVTVTPGTTQTISPYIYGVNGASSGFTGSPNQWPVGTSSSVPSGVTLDRWGGDRLTAYNWETNNSNCGADCGGTFPNDNGVYTSPNTPASPITDRITFDRANNIATVVGFPMQGYVAADAAGSVSITGTIPAPGRFDTVQYAKGSAFVINPSPGNPVYDDELAYNLNNSFSGIFTSSTLPAFMELDNEPDLWPNTHAELTSSLITPSAFFTQTIALSTALKNLYAGAKVFGPVNWGWSGIQSWQSAISGTTNTSNNWFIDQYASAVKAASTTYGHPLVDVYDFHWYPQVQDPVSGYLSLGSLNSSPLSDAQTQLIVQWPRSLYDSTYVENSWIPGTIGGAAINALPRFNAKLAAANPGMQLAITEYFPGGGATIAGTLSEADILGAFGANNVFAANCWPLTGVFPSVIGGFNAYRNFDGAGSNFGNTSVLASSSAIANVSAYVSTDTTHSGRVVMVLINRSNAQQNTTVTGQPLTGTAHIYQMTSANIPTGTSQMMPTSIGTQSVSGSSIYIQLPAYSVSTLDIH